MTRKHFVAVAATVAALPSAAERRAKADEFAVMFSKANPRFDRARFLAACGVK